MGLNAQVLTTAIASGHALEAGLQQLHAMGVTPVEAIKAIREAKSVNLGEAKRIFSLSPAWSQEVRSADALHDEVFSIVAEEKMP